MLKESFTGGFARLLPKMAIFIIFTVLLTTCGENVVSDDVPDEMQRVAKEVVTDRFGIPRENIGRRKARWEQKIIFQLYLTVTECPMARSTLW